MLKNTDTDMTKGVIWKQLIGFALPMMIGLLFQQLYNTVDTWVVGNFCENATIALAAVSCNGNIINVLVGTFAGLATGASIVIAQEYGAHNDETLSKAVHTTFAVTLLLCVAGTAIGLLTAKPLLMLTKPDADVKADALDYLFIYFAGLPGLLMYNIGSGILRAVGDSKRPVYFLIVSAVLNTVLDILFVAAFGWGVKGVAYATIIAEFVSALLVVYVLLTANTSYSVKLKKLRIDKEQFIRIVTLGLPSAIQSGITSFSNVFVQSYVNSFGKEGMAAWGIYNKLDAFTILPLQSLSLASSTFAGQNWGAGLKERTKKGVAVAIYMSLICTFVLALALILFAPWLVGFFAKDADKELEAKVLEYGVYFVRVISGFYMTINFNQIYSGALRGIGTTVMPTVIMLSSFVAFRQIYLYVTCHLLGYMGNKLVISLAYPMGWILCSTLLIICYFNSALFKDPNDYTGRKKSLLQFIQR